MREATDRVPSPRREDTKDDAHESTGDDEGEDNEGRNDVQADVDVVDGSSSTDGQQDRHLGESVSMEVDEEKVDKLENPSEQCDYDSDAGNWLRTIHVYLVVEIACCGFV